MKFEELKIKQEGSWISRTVKSQQFKKSIIAISIGGIAGFLFFYFGEAQNLDEIPTHDIIRSILIGGFFGFFITNSPCARGRC